MKRLLSIIIYVSLFACAGVGPNSAPTVADGATIHVPGAPFPGDGGKSDTGEETGSAGGSSASGSYQAAPSTPAENGDDEDWVEAPWTGGGGAGVDSALPQASLPTPTLLKTLVADADYNNGVSGVGYAGAVPAGQRVGHEVLMVAQSEADVALRQLDRPSIADKLFASIYRVLNQFNFKKHFIKIAFAGATTPMPIVEGPFTKLTKATKEHLVLDKTGNVVSELPINLEQARPCKIEADGSFECRDEASADPDNTPYCFFITDGAKLINFAGQDLQNCDKPNPHVKWLRKKPLDIDSLEAGDFTPVGVITENSLVALGRDSNNKLKVLGQQVKYYEKLPVTGIELAMSALGTEQRVYSTRGGKISNYTIGADGLETSELIPDPGTTPTKLKRTSNGSVMFAIEFTSDIKNNPADGVIKDITGANKNIVFFDAKKDDSALQPKKVLDFDVDEAGVLSVVYLDAENRTRMTAIAGDGEKIGNILLHEAALALTGYEVFAKEGFVKRALLLNESSNQLDFFMYSKGSKTIIKNPTAVPLGVNPNGLILSPKKTKAYVIDQTEEALYQVTLIHDGIILEPNEILANNHIKKLNLKPFITGKDIKIQPDQISYEAGDKADSSNDDLLVLTAPAMKSVLVIPVANF